MGYSIQYASNKMCRKMKRNTDRNKYSCWLVILAAVIIPCLVLILCGYQMTNENSCYGLMFEQNQPVQDAFNEFSDSVRSGERFSDALECLWRQILEYEDAK